MLHGLRANIAPVSGSISVTTETAAAPRDGPSTHSTYAVQPGDVCLVHAAAGGAGGMIVQMAKARGGRVFGTVSTEQKAQVAREAGVDEAILYTEKDFETEVKRLASGGVHVVYDSVGKTTFEKSLACLRPRGMLALFGQSSGPVTLSAAAMSSRQQCASPIRAATSEGASRRHVPG